MPKKIYYRGRTPKLPSDTDHTRNPFVKYSGKRKKKKPRHHNTVTVTCLRCGKKTEKPLKRKNLNTWRAKYCGRRCAIKKNVFFKSISKHKDDGSNFYMSDEWRAVRYVVLKERGRKCECCGASPKDGRQVHVDHIKPRAKHPELSLAKENLQVLCADCNIGKKDSDDIDWRLENERAR